MAQQPTYNDGTVTVDANSITVTGVGTAFTTYVKAGDYFWAQGRSVRILTVNSATQLTLATGWPGTAISGGNYEIIYTPAQQVAQAKTTALLGQLSNGNLSSIAALTTAADKLAYYAGAGVAALLDFKSWARSFLGAADAAAGRTALGLGSIATRAAPSGAVVGDSDTQTLANKTLTNPTLNGATFNSSITAPGFVSLNAAGLLSLTRDGSQVMIANRITSTGQLFSMRYGGTQVGEITVTGSATAYLTTSDWRAKFDVVDLVNRDFAPDLLDALPDALRLALERRPVSYSFISDPDSGMHYGYIAHWLAEQAPQAVNGEKDAVTEIGVAVSPDGSEAITDIPIDESPDGWVWTKTGERPRFQSVDNSKIVPLLDRDLQELILFVAQQQAQIANLAARVAALEA